MMAQNQDQIYVSGEKELDTQERLKGPHWLWVVAPAQYCLRILVT